MEEVVVVKEVMKGYGRVKALDGVSLRLNKGQRLVILGENGSGKSTLLRIIAGLELPDYGAVEVRARKIALVPDFIPDFGRMRVWELIALIAEENGLSHRTPEQWVREFGIDRLGDRVKNLSKGMRRRLMLAVSLGIGADLPLLDEPYNGLDVGGRTVFSNKLKELETYILTTHIISEIPPSATHLAYMQDGRIEDIADRGTGVWISGKPCGERSYPFGPKEYIVFGGGEGERIF